MDLDHQEKTSFITPWGTYCYIVMPFGLKIARATYQRAATTLFHDMIHTNIEVYVNNMIIKSLDRENHIPTLRVFFERLIRFQICLNPQKCVFRVIKGKMFGSMVNKKEIEVDPAKVKAIKKCSFQKLKRKFMDS